LNVDLHCHSIVSDGFLAPAELVRHGSENGVDVLALTDHDEISGVAEARLAAQGLPMRLIAGVEVSVSWGGDTVHIVGLGIDIESALLLDGLRRLRAGRDTRAAAMADELAAVGIRGALEGARRYAANPALVSRAHFARYMVELGLMPDTRTVFSHYLVPGKPGYVEHTWAALDEAVDWIHAAGGLAVIAHPGRCRLSGVELLKLLDHFRELGGEAIEVVSGAHDAAATRKFATLARRFGFLASRASDFHGVNESPVDLGRAPPLPPDLAPVWERLI
jgi:predicted metal-dependent phosphoesterase TrpH